MSLPLSAPQREIGKTEAPGVYGSVDDENSVKLLEKTLEIGCNFWDTAGSPKGVFLATKFAIDFTGSVPRINGTPEFLNKAYEAPLKNLGTDYIDLYYSYRIDTTTPIEIPVRAMAELVKQSKVKYLGLSECSAETLSHAHKVHPITAVQVEYSPWTLNHEDNDLINTCREHGQMKFLDELEADDWRRTVPHFQGENFANNLELADKIKAIADRKGVTAGQISLAWLLAQVFAGEYGSRGVQLSKKELGEVRKIPESFDVAGERYNPEMMATLDN
ncbi:hypothetical protein INT43_002239 [Umbelopsis isabellina]|uniref:NADP-dependent oxidoreductase domain-containing protein n=1 Tax=Mortierella isabellina TaxID=91625 RepID=A0A8H7Q461_MORIS|nr:hypothetical protein INT43_002239 [Umbelopsis isabellina]